MSAIILAKVKPYEFTEEFEFQTSIVESSLKYEIDIFEKTVYNKNKYTFENYQKQLILYLKMKFPNAIIKQ